MVNKREKLLIGIITLAAVISGSLYLISLRSSVRQSNDASSNGPGIGIPDLKSQVMVNELSNVWDIGFLPDNTMVFTEREGTISKVQDGKKVVIHNVANIYNRGEGGLLGMAVDPLFEQNRYLYACYNTSSDIRVSRWRVNNDASSLAEQTDIITGIPVNTSTFPGRHSGCRPRFDNENRLWIGTGDAAIGINPQVPTTLGGKILRVSRDGQPVAGNLSHPFDPRIFSYGHRNVQGLALLDEPKAGLFGYSVEHGPDRDDEINPLKSGNFGWNPVPGYNERVPMTDKETFPDAVESLWSSGSSTIAPSGAAIIKGEKWDEYENRLAVAVLKDKHIRLFAFGLDGRTIVDERQIFKDQFGRIRSVVTGPDNDLFLTTDNGRALDKIIRINPR